MYIYIYIYMCIYMVSCRNEPTVKITTVQSVQYVISKYST